MHTAQHFSGLTCPRTGQRVRRWPPKHSMLLVVRLLLWALLTNVPALAEQPAAADSLDEVLSRSILSPDLPLEQVQAYTESRVPPMPEVTTVAEWEAQVDAMRQQTLDCVIYRGEAKQWRDMETRIEWLDEIEGGPGYKIRKLRFEAVPGLWVPALLYEPLELTGKVPVGLNVNGHDGTGKAAEYKQIRCINQAKRGMIALNVEWLGMGQLNAEGLQHYRMNQLDLCGTSGLSPFYLSLKRSLDVLLSHPHADPERVLVAGLSGGGWQTIIISSLDERVTLANPVAGYSSFRTRARNLSDLGDSEQTPTDLATVTDYAQLTAMRAPRPTLLTFNAKDDCCFRADHALPPLLDAAQPIFKLYGKGENLESHINDDPGTHNFEIDNRQALYRMIGRHFYPEVKDFSAKEIGSRSEVKSSEELAVDLPDGNATFNTLAAGLLARLARDPEIPDDDTQLAEWQNQRRQVLRDVMRAESYAIEGEMKGETPFDGGTAVYWQLNIDHTWSIPAVELIPAKAQHTSLLIADTGRATAGEQVKQLLDQGHRVLAVDPFYFGEASISQRDFLFALLVSAVGERPLGVQAAQVQAAAAWLRDWHSQPVQLVAVGPRTSTIALAAAAFDSETVSAVALHGAWGSLERLIEENQPVTYAPELFCFGLLREFDLPQLVQLVAPRPVVFHEPAEDVRARMGELRDFYGRFGSEFDPLAPPAVDQEP